MKTIYRRLLFIGLMGVFMCGVLYSAHDPRYNVKRPESTKGLSKKAAEEQFHGYQFGFDMRVWMGNMSVMGRNYAEANLPGGQYGLEYPQGLGIEHLYGAGPWIGAIVDTSTSGTPRFVRAVTTGYEGWSAPREEFFGRPDGSDKFYLTSRLPLNGANRRRYDDDNDDKIDEDELNGIDDDHDGRIDEDYGAVSERDAYVGYGDFYDEPRVANHVPLGIRVWQRAFSWQSDVKEPFIPIEYYFMNVGNKILRDVYVGFFADCDVGPNVSSYWTRNAAGYFRDLRTAYVINPVDRPASPIGITVLGTPRSLEDLRYTFHHYPGGQSPTPDIQRYTVMSSGIIDPDEYPVLSDTRFFFSFGPFDTMKTGDTLKIVVALVSGEALSEGENNLEDNAAKAIELYAREFNVPPAPPAPPLHIQVGDDRVHLNWKWVPADTDKVPFDPLQTWDESNKFIGKLPSSHWRRRNPELRGDTVFQPGIAGGRNMEGFRVWRSESPVNPAPKESFALLGQYDIHDTLGYDSSGQPISYGEGGAIGDPLIYPGSSLIGYDYVDSNLVRGRRYTYAVTSFSLPGITEIEQPGGGVDLLESPPLESAIAKNQTLVIIPFQPSVKVGDVKVVPNPYRTDVDYTNEAGGWEGLGRFWDESKRVIWFIHLPAKCTIRVFSLTGDLVATIEHDDPLRQALEKVDNSPRPVGQEEWNLLTESGRAIASGIYVYTVESEYGRQIGKFVVIR